MTARCARQEPLGQREGRSIRAGAAAAALRQLTSRKICTCCSFPSLLCRTRSFTDLSARGGEWDAGWGQGAGLA